VIPKGKFYLYLSTGGSQKANFENFTEKIDQKKGIRIFNHFGTYNWLRRFKGDHPPAIDRLRKDLDSGCLCIETRSTYDIDKLLFSHKYIFVTKLLCILEMARAYCLHSIYFLKSFSKRIFISHPKFIQYVMLPLLPKSYKIKLEKLRDQ